MAEGNTGSIIITGGTRGIGLALARGLQAGGAAVSVWGRDPAAVEAARNDHGLHALVCDVTDVEQVQQSLRVSTDDLGALRGMVTCAGRSSNYRSILDLSPHDFKAVIDTNLFGTFTCLQAAAQTLVQQGTGGRLVAISSIRASRSASHAPEYTASKTGVEGLVRSMALALAPSGITVNAVRPGWFATDMTATLRQDSTLSDELIQRVPVRRWGEPGDMVGVVHYLLSDASSFHTGDVITVDGGYSAGDSQDPNGRVHRPDRSAVAG